MDRNAPGVGRREFLGPFFASVLLGGCAAREQEDAHPPSQPAPAPTPATDGHVGRADTSLKCEPLTLDVPALDDSEMAVKAVPLFDPTSKGMATFYTRLARLMRGRARDHVRIGIYGDSNMTMDYIAGPMRRDLQKRFGDAGHGFIALAKPWSHYRHMDIVHEVGVAFTSYAVTTKPTGDGAYGYCGIVGESPAVGSRVRLGTAPASSPVGHKASRFDVFYLKGPGRGQFDVVVDNKKVVRLDTAAKERGVGIYRTEVEDGPHTFDSVVQTPHYVRFLGGVLERTTEPGIIVDQLGVGAMGTRCIPMEDPKISAPMLEYRRYDLVILMTGMADIFEVEKTKGVIKQVVELHRKAKPNVSFLLISPPDRGVSHATQKLLALAKQRKALASEIGVGYWDWIEAMGGPTSMMKFIRKQLALPDQIHFSERGGAWVSRRLTHAILSGFSQFLAEHPDAGCAEGDAVEELAPWSAGDHVRAPA